jgi:WD40 repeat protein
MSSRVFTAAFVCLAAALAASADEQKPDAKAKAAPRVDSHGDALPDGAVVRLGTARIRQVGRPGGVAFSADGKRVATWGTGGVHVADAVTGETLEELARSVVAARFGPDGKLASVPDAGVTAAAYSPDGKLVAHGLRDGVNNGTVRVRDAATGKLLHELTGPKDEVRGLALSADGKKLARAGQKSVGLWDIATGKETRLLDATRDGSPFCAAFSPDGKTVVTGDYFGTPAIRMWDAATGKELFAVTDLPVGYFPRAVAFAPDGKTFAHTGEGGMVFLRAAVDGKEVRRFKTERDAHGVAFSPDGKTLAASVSQYPAGAETRVFDVETGKERFAFPRHELRVETVFYSADGKRVVTSGIDRTVRVWDAETGKHLFAVGSKHIESISRRGLPCALSPDGKTLLVARDEAIEVWDVTTGKLSRTLTSPDGRVVSLSVAPTGKVFKALCAEANRNPERDVFISDHVVHVLDVATGKSSLKIPGLDAAVARVVASPEGTLIAVGAPDALHRDGVTLYSPAGRKLHAFVQSKGKGPVMSCFAISPDDKVLVAATDKLRFWDTTSGDEVRAFDAPARARFFALVFSPNGKYLAGAEHSRFVVLEAATGKVVWERPNLTSDATTPAFSPDGKRLAAAGPNGTVLVWEMPADVSRR